MDLLDAHGPGSSTLKAATEATPGTPPPPDANTTTKANTEMGVLVILYIVLGVVFFIAFSYGAAKLSYDKYRSVGWAILDFFFSSFYYPYYAIFLNTPTYVGGRR